MQLTNELEQQLKAKFNPEGSDLRKAQHRMLELLLWVDEVCKKNNIPYFLEGGTLLGAVRHKGFIPWDDDVDIAVPYSYYEKLEKAFEQEKHPQFVLQSAKTDPYSYKRWLVVRDKNSRYVHSLEHLIRRESIMKYRGVQVDIFPYDNRVVDSVQRLVSYDWPGVEINRLGTGYMARQLGRFCFHSLVALSKLAKFFSPVSQWWTYGYGCCFRYRYNDECLFPLSEVVFEGHCFPAPHNPDEYLKAHYGNYMELPSLEEFNHHRLYGIEIW